MFEKSMNTYNILFPTAPTPRAFVFSPLRLLALCLFSLRIVAERVVLFLEYCIPRMRRNSLHLKKGSSMVSSKITKVSYLVQTK